MNVGNLQNIFMEHDLYLKYDTFFKDHYFVYLV